MTTATVISNALVAVGAKPFATTIQALRDNPIAISECDVSAWTNRPAWHPYNRIAAGSTASGRIYNFGTDGALANVVTPDYEDGFEYRIRLVGVSPTGTGVDLQIENYRETDTAYNAAHFLIASPSGANLIGGDIELLDVRQSLRVHVFRARTAIASTNSAIASTTADRADLFTTSQKILRSRISFTLSTTIDAGQIFLDRRAVYS
jgi:hypothetical protein